MIMVNHQQTSTERRTLMRELMQMAEAYLGRLEAKPRDFVTFRNMGIMYGGLHGVPCVVLETRDVQIADADRLNVRIAYVLEGCTHVAWVEHWFLEPWTPDHEKIFDLAGAKTAGGTN